MAPRILVPITILAALGGCATLGEPVLDADGCRPAMAIYQPAVGPGGAGQVIHVPRSCPQALIATPEMLAALAATGAEDGRRDAIQGTPRTERPSPPPPVSALAAIRSGVEDFCGWFLGGQSYSLEGLGQAAFDAGYARGAGVQFFPLPEMLREPSFSALGFTAVIADRPSDGHGVAAFVSFHHPTCQIQVFGHGAEAETALTQLEAAGWRKVGGLVTGEDWTAQRYYGGEAGRPLTMVVTHATRDGEGPGLDMVINIVPGENPQRGLLFEPAA